MTETHVRPVIGRPDGFGRWRFTHAGRDYKIERSIFKSHGDWTRHYRLFDVSFDQEQGLGTFTRLSVLRDYVMTRVVRSDEGFVEAMRQTNQKTLERWADETTSPHIGPRRREVAQQVLAERARGKEAAK